MCIAADIASANPSEPSMALIHTTTVSLFRQVCCGTTSLIPQLCPVMLKPLTYFFYGRPAYRPGPMSPTNRDCDSRPVCLLFRREAVQSITGIYPCDTGAHDRGFYSPFLDGIAFADLDCVGVVDADKRIVSRFFGANDSYFYGEEFATLTPPATNAIARKFHDLISSPRITECDDRSQTIELTQDHFQELDNALESIVVPDFLLAEPLVASAIRRWEAAGTTVSSYRPQRRTSAGRTVEQLFPVVGSLQGLPS